MMNMKAYSTVTTQEELRRFMVISILITQLLDIIATDTIKIYKIIQQE